MAKIVCAKKHFGKGGKVIAVGTESEGHPDGKFWVAKSGSGSSDKKLEVATPKKEQK